MTNTAATIVPRFDSEGGIEPEVRNMDISGADKQGLNVAWQMMIIGLVVCLLDARRNIYYSVIGRTDP